MNSNTIRFRFCVEDQILDVKNPYCLSPVIPKFIIVNDVNMTKKLTGQSWLTHSAVAIITKYLKNFPYDIESIRRQFKLQNKDKSPSKRKRDLERGQAYKRKRMSGSSATVENHKIETEIKTESVKCETTTIQEVIVSTSKLSLQSQAQIPPIPEDKVGFRGDTLQERISNHFRAVNSGQAADLVYLNSVKKLFTGVTKKKPIFDSIANYSKMSLSEIRREYSKFVPGGVVAPTTSGGVVLPPSTPPKSNVKSSEKSTAIEDECVTYYSPDASIDIDMSIYSEASITMEYIEVLDLTRLRYLHTYELELKKSRKYSTLSNKDQRMVNDHIYELAERLAAESQEYQEYARWHSGQNNKQMVRGEKHTQQWSRAKQKRIQY